MNVMNKGIYASIKSYAKEIGKNLTIFVSSRAQSRSTALELISHLASDDVTGDTISFLNCRESNLEFSLQNISDKVAKHALSFGIGLHHNALSSNDKDIILNMYNKGEIKVLISTVETVWKSDFSSLIIIKGTEKFDVATRQYVEYPLSVLYHILKSIQCKIYA